MRTHLYFHHFVTSHRVCYFLFECIQGICTLTSLNRKALSVDLQEGTKVEFEAAIRTALRASTKAQKDPRFADLWKSIQEGEQRRSSARAKSESARSDFGDMESEQPRYLSPLVSCIPHNPS